MRRGNNHIYRTFLALSVLQLPQRPYFAFIKILHEQQVLLAHQRAISEPLPEEMNPVWNGTKAEVLSLAGVEEAGDVGTGEAEVSIDNREKKSCSCDNSGSIDNPKSQLGYSENLGSIATAESQPRSSVDSRSIAKNTSLEAESSSHLPKNPAVAIPVDSDGLAENPESYKIWQPKKMEREAMSAQEWKERWSKLKKKICFKSI